MDNHHRLNVVVRASLAERGITSLRDAADAIDMNKDAIWRRYKGDVSWTIPDLEKVAGFLDISLADLIAKRDAA